MSQLTNQRKMTISKMSKKTKNARVRVAVREDRLAIRALVGRSRSKRLKASIGKPSRSRRTGRKQAGRGSSNAAYNTARYGAGMRTVTDGISIMKTIHNGSVIEDTFSIRREKVSNIVGSTGSTLNIKQQLFLNPGNTVLFPIFSQIAATYEQFRVNTLVFSYETEAYAASGTAVSAGKVILATNYDPADSAFSSDGQMENYFNSDRGAPYCEIVHDVLMGDHALKDEPLKDYFVNSSANLIAPTSDSTNNKFYDLGNFQLGTQGTVDATSEIGELYVTYSFTMIRPKQQTPLGQNLVATHIVESANGTATAAAPLGTTGGVNRAGGNISSVVTTTTFTLPLQGRFMVSGAWVGSTITSSPTYGLGANIVGVSILSDNGGSNINGFTAIRGFNIAVFDVTAAGVGAANTVTIGGLATMTAATADILISQVSSGLLLSSREAKTATINSTLMARLQALESKYALLSIDESDSEYIVNESQTHGPACPINSPVMTRSTNVLFDELSRRIHSAK